MPAVTPSPLPETKFSMLERLVEDLDAPALHWLSGYMAGAASRLQPTPLAMPGKAAAPAADTRQRLTVLYGSQTGNAKRVAEDLARRAQADGLLVRLVRADAYPVRELKEERLLYIVISTQGEGEPPDDARGFVEFLAGRRAPRLPELKYAVLGLGDSSYPLFCGIGRDIDARLAELGAARLQDAGYADLDIETVAGPWSERALAGAREQLARAPMASVTPLRPAQPAAALHGRDHPYPAEVLANQRITARGSEKDIRHIELSLEGSGLRYEPGDALGVWPQQAPELVEAVLDALGLDGAEPVAAAGQTLPLAQWLRDKRELTRLTRPFLAAHAERNGDARLAHALAPEGRDQLAALFDGYQLIDLLREFPASWSGRELVAALRPLAPRMYSIASSQAEVEDEVHLTVAHVAYEAFGQARWGAASRHLAGLEDGARTPVFVEANERFRLPADGARDIIMIGPGTGVAPFRAFVQARAAAGAGGRNWLFFGNPHFHSDFLYQAEWQQALKDGRLDRIDLAFSRDQAGKIYVQHRLLERGRELYGWLQEGAHLYVCGDASRMARDVHAALLAVARTHGGKDAEAAGAWLSELAAQGRYARDVY